MKKKLVAALMSCAMVGGLLAGCGSSSDNASSDNTTPEKKTEETAEANTQADDDAAFETQEVGDDGIKIWVADAVVDFTKDKVAQFQQDNPEYADYTIVVEPVGEGDAAGNVITDVEAGADIYAFAQDQIARLVAAGALEEVNPDVLDAVSSENDAGAVKAATVGDTLYAYPLTSDNGYFLYYDKSVVSDPSTLEGIIKDCEDAGKNFYMEINSGWYQTAFFFATGAELTYETDDSGAFTKANVSYASDKGVVALKEMIELAGSSAFQNGSAVGEATNVAAIVVGTWDSSAAQELFGDNYACAKLPEFEGSDGQTYQMSGFGGFKLLGVKPQTNEDKLAACDAIAYYLASEDVQLARYQEVGWGPSNLNAQQSDEVQADVALSALADQLQYTIPQGQYPGDYWDLAVALGDSVRNGELSADSSDDDLLSALQDFQDTCISYAQ